VAVAPRVVVRVCVSFLSVLARLVVALAVGIDAGGVCVRSLRSS